MVYLIKTNVTNQFGFPAYLTGFMKGRGLFIWSRQGNEIKEKAISFVTEELANDYIREFKFVNCSVEKIDK